VGNQERSNSPNRKKRVYFLLLLHAYLTWASDCECACVRVFMYKWLCVHAKKKFNSLCSVGKNYAYSLGTQKTQLVPETGGGKNHHPAGRQQNIWWSVKHKHSQSLAHVRYAWRSNKKYTLFFLFGELLRSWFPTSPNV
jgi:hypothetical protein